MGKNVVRNKIDLSPRLWCQGQDHQPIPNLEKTIETRSVNRVGELVPKKAITNDPFWLDMWRSE